MKFKVGDRVEYIGNNLFDPLSYGDKGIVIGCLANKKSYGVEWDKENSRMHDNFGKGRNYHCWDVFGEEIRKVKEEKKMTSNAVINALIAKLDVEVGEQFNIIGVYRNPYHFREDGKLIDCSGDSREDIIGYLAFDLYRINKISVKEMTVSEIEKELGYKIKVVADKEEKK